MGDAQVCRSVPKWLNDELTRTRMLDFPKEQKSKPGKEIVFYCCQCYNTRPLLSSLYVGCMDCGHYRCYSCDIEGDPCCSIGGEEGDSHYSTRSKEDNLYYSTRSKQKKQRELAATRLAAELNPTLAASSHCGWYLFAIPKLTSPDVVFGNGLDDLMTKFGNTELQRHDWNSSQSNYSPWDSSMSTAYSCESVTPATSWELESSTSHESEPLDSLQIVPRRQPREVVIDFLLQILREWLHAYIRKKSPNPAADRGGRATNTKTPSCRTTSPDTSAKLAVLESLKKRLDLDEEDHDEEDSGRRKKRKGQEFPDACPTSSNSSLRFACHFLKRRPLKYSDSRWEACRGPKPRKGFKEVHRVKEHLIKYHSIKPRCGICGDTFELQSEMEEHLRTIKCELKDLPPLEGLTPDMHIRISSRTGLSKMTASEKWVHWHKIVFPNDILDSIPTPYHDESPRQMSLSEDYYRYDFIADMRTELVRRIPNEMRDIMPQLLDILKSTAYDIQSRRTRIEDQKGRVVDAHRPTPELGATSSKDALSRRDQEMQPRDSATQMQIWSAMTSGNGAAQTDGQVQLEDNSNLNTPWDSMFDGVFDQPWLNLTENDRLVADATAKFDFDPEELIDF